MSSIFLNIITPLTRPQNLAVMGRSIQLAIPHVNFRWIVVMDGDYSMFRDYLTPYWDNIEYHTFPSDGKGIAGNTQRNFGLDLVSEGHVYFLNDDNIMHPKFNNAIIIAEQFDDYSIVFHQQLKTGTTRLFAHPKNMKETFVEASQWIVPREMVGDLRWEPFNYCADGVFVETLYNFYPERFLFIGEGLSYYNYLRSS
jgi:hypothetical protein